MSNEALPQKAYRQQLQDIVQRLRQSREETHSIGRRDQAREYPSPHALAGVVDGLVAALFPSHFGRRHVTDENVDFFVGETLSNVISTLTEQVRKGLLATQGHTESIENEAERVVHDFAGALPEIRGMLVEDVQAAYSGDPAANSVSEILLSYQGMKAIIYYRFAHALHELGARLVARVISEIAHSRTAVDIHPGASIGRCFFIDHGTGVVVGETAVIGDNVRLYQAVTLGAKSFPKDETGALVKGLARHPIVEDDVVIYAGATVLGRVTIGKGSVVGGNVWLTSSVPPGSSVTQAGVRQELMEQGSGI